jgi:hypothetical protein
MLSSPSLPFAIEKPMQELDERAKEGSPGFG